MIRATTPTHIFYFEDDPSEFERILITYTQGDSIVLEKEKEDLTIEAIDPEPSEDEQEDESTASHSCYAGNYKAYYRLTQEETRMFKADSMGKKLPVQVQVRALTTSGEALASEKHNICVVDVLNDEVLE